MIIHLKSKLFTVPPEKRFAKEFGVDEKVWLDCWLKYKVLGLTVNELCEYIHIRTGRKPSHISIKRWIMRSEVYSLARFAIKQGANTVVSSYFGEYEEIVLNELLRHMKSGVTVSVRSLL